MTSRAAALLALVACGSSAPPPALSNKAPAPSYGAALEDWLGFLPVDSEIVVGIDSKQIRTTAVWSQLLPKIEKDMGRDLDEVRAACGFDPFQTVERVSVGLRAIERDKLVGVIVVHGVGAGMMGCVRSHFGKGGTVSDDKGVLVMDSHPDMRSAWTVIGSTLIVQLDPAAGHDSMQVVLASGAPLRGSKAFMDLYGGIAKGASLWGVVNGRSKMLDEFGSMRPRNTKGTITLSDRIVIDGDAVFETVDVANQVDALVKGTFQQVHQWIESGDTRIDGSTLLIKAVIGPAQLSQILQML
jgi:hypothetical protein